MALWSATFRPTWGVRMSISEISLQTLPYGIEVDRRAGEIRKEGLKISLPEQLFRLLVLLMEHPGEVVTREEIRNSLWSDTFVNFDDSINSGSAWKIRLKILGSLKHCPATDIALLCPRSMSRRFPNYTPVRLTWWNHVSQFCRSRTYQVIQQMNTLLMA